VGVRDWGEGEVGEVAVDHWRKRQQVGEGGKGMGKPGWREKRGRVDREFKKKGHTVRVAL